MQLALLAGRYSKPHTAASAILPTSASDAAAAAAAVINAEICELLVPDQRYLSVYDGILFIAQNAAVMLKSHIHRPKQGNFEKVVIPPTCYLFNGTRFHFHLCVTGMEFPRSLISCIVFDGLVTLTFDFLTFKQVHRLPV